MCLALASLGSFVQQASITTTTHSLPTHNKNNKNKNKNNKQQTTIVAGLGLADLQVGIPGPLST